MPHVVLNGDIAIDDAFSRVQPLLVRGETGLLKTAGAYLARDRKSILVEALALETDTKRSFLVMISERDDGIVVRIYPGTEVEKTPGVKRVLAEQVRQFMAAFPGLRVGKTNLAEYLDTPLAQQ